MENLKLSAPKKIVMIGASTGGPGHIQKIIDSLPKLKNTSIIVAQHMIEGFIESFANRLQINSINSVKIVTDKQSFVESNIYVCEGETELHLNNHEFTFTQKASNENTYNPNIDILFNSFLPLCNEKNILCVILTGIGDDGIEGCKNLKLKGTRCLTESSDSAIVDGMPNRARALVEGIEVYDIDEIANIVSEFCQ